MRTRSFALTALSSLAITTMAHSAEPMPKPTDWQDDPVCQMVFFAVLEGLYTDGVSDEVVASIIGPKTADIKSKVKTSFVFKCPLCHPAYEAFALYQQRQAFLKGDGKRDTFGKGLDAPQTMGLLSKSDSSRVMTLEGPMQRWVTARLARMRLSDEELKSWSDRLNQRSNEGGAQLGHLRQHDPRYESWNGYWGCAACRGSARACSALTHTPTRNLALDGESKPPADWRDDPVCQMVFFAVLEGLYTSGISDEIVESLIGPKPKEGEKKLKSSFVIQCPLCHPTYEALALYQQRRPFVQGDGKRSTFGKGIDPELIKQLESPIVMTRLKGLRVLVHRWVDDRLKLMRLSEAEEEQMRTRLSKRVEEGFNELRTLQGTDPNYTGWSMYWGCAACLGCRDAATKTRVDPTPKDE